MLISSDSLANARRHAKVSMQKFALMQDLYLKRVAYTEDHEDAVKKALAPLLYKYLVSICHLEALWAHSEERRLSLSEVFSAALRADSWTEDELFVATTELEAFLFQARAFLDMYMRYSCVLFGRLDIRRISRKAFRRSISAAARDSRFSERAAAVRDYFAADVFGPNSWGLLLAGLRDKIAHHDILEPSREGVEEISGNLLDWPTIQGLTFERLSQEFNNGCFELMRSTAEPLFELPWKSGAFRTDLWAEET